MSVVRITLKKTLAPGAYACHHAVPASFASEYIVRTRAEFPSPILLGYAWNIAQAESRLYRSCVRFEDAVVKLVPLGVNGQDARGEHSRVDLEKLQGQLPMNEDDILMYPPVAAVIGREASNGRHGRQLLPHILTTSEWTLYAQKRVLPARLQHPNGLDQTPFNRELLAAIKEADGIYVMAPGEGDSEQSLRTIDLFYFHSFHVASLKTKKRKASAAAKRRAGSATSASGTSNAPVEGVVYMLQFGQAFKIGKSINPNKRIGQLKTQFPYAVTVVHVIQATHPTQVEFHWHKRFASKRLKGEWFELTPEEVEEFKSVVAM